MYFTSQEQIRIDIISKYLSGLISREHAYNALELGERQFRRVVKSFREKGPSSVKHGNCGQVPKNKTSQALESSILQFANGKYKGFNMTHFREKLEDEKDFSQLPSYGTIRRILTENKVYSPRKKRAKRPHKSRNRYEREGIMVQIDGSHHQWFGDRKTCLIAGVDDATGKLLGAKFSETETSLDTMDVIEQMVTTYGCFQILYSDKAGIYDNAKREGFTNVTRAIRQLGITSVLANSAEAKGRIERVWGTLQDRLISEMRLRNIQTMEEANIFLQEYIHIYNKKFSVIPASPLSGFVPLPPGINLEKIFYTVEQRKVGSGCSIKFNNEIYIIKNNLTVSLRRLSVDIRTYRNGEKKFFINDVEVEVEKLIRPRRVA